MITNLLTNIVMVLVSMVVTNDVPQWQYKQTMYYATMPMQVEETWVDEKPLGFQEPDIRGWGFISEQNKRINPSKRVEEVRWLSFLEFTYEGKPYRIQVTDKLLARREWNKFQEPVKEVWVMKQEYKPLEDGGRE